jgi:predicted nucleotidyltransferase
MNKIQELVKRELAHPPKWLPENTMYETDVGSVAYGVVGTSSDRDIYGFCIPPKLIVFPHLAGYIMGFGKPYKPFNQYQEHHIKDDTALGGKGVVYDVSIYSIVRYFQLCMENNPNMIDSLFTPERCVITRTHIWEMVKRNRHTFLHRGCYHKFRGYAYAQLHKMQPKFEEDENGKYVQVLPQGKRAELVKQFGYDVKFGYHLVRLSLECEQILSEETLDLERNREILKSIRRGDWTLEEIELWFASKEKQLESLYNLSKLPYKPDEDKIKSLLLNCLEHHYGTLGNAVIFPGRDRKALIAIQEILENTL